MNQWTVDRRHQSISALYVLTLYQPRALTEFNKFVFLVFLPEKIVNNAHSQYD